MYSIALLVALTGSTEVSDGHRHGGGGCCGQVASCGCGGGGHRHHGGRCGHHRHGGGCCGYQASCCNTCQAPVSCGCYGGGVPYGAPYGAPMGAPVAPPAGEQIKKMPAQKTTLLSAPAVIVVELPADATLKVDGEATASGVRVLVSPELPAGKEFHYTLTARVVRDGKPLQVEQRVSVRAGEESRINLGMPTADVVLR